jgi:monovalent cation:H+ antiporter-2, CPA2 family
VPHLALLLIELGGVTLVLALLARLGARIGLSPIPFYLIAGLVLGEGGIVPLVTSEEFIEVGAEIGVVLLLFMLGLEYSAEELVGNLRSVAPAGLIDLALCFPPGFIAGLLLGWGIVPAVLLGGITYISSSGMVAKLLTDMGWLGNRETPTVLSVLVFEDLVMAVFLPVVAVLTVGGDAFGLVGSVALALGLVAAVLFIAYRASARLSDLAFHHNDEALLLTVFGITLLFAGLAQLINLSSAVGAFLVGIVLSGPAADKVRPMLVPLQNLFAAVFFVFFGLQTDPAAIPPVLLPALALAVVVGLAKWLTGHTAARRVGVGPRGQNRAGVMLIAHGEFSLVIAALASGTVVAAELNALTAAFVMLLAVAGPILAQIAGRPPKSGPRRARPEPATREATPA